MSRPRVGWLLATAAVLAGGVPGTAAHPPPGASADATKIDHTDHGRMHLLLFGLYALTLAGAQAGLVLWHRRSPRTFRLASAAGVWFIPAGVALARGYIPFLVAWVPFTAINVAMLWHALGRRRLLPVAPRAVYQWHLLLFQLSSALSSAGYALLVGCFLGAGSVGAGRSSGLWAASLRLAAQLCFYGLYFGLLARDCAVLCAERMLLKMRLFAGPGVKVAGSPGAGAGAGPGSGFLRTATRLTSSLLVSGPPAPGGLLPTHVAHADSPAPRAQDPAELLSPSSGDLGSQSRLADELGVQLPFGGAPSRLDDGLLKCGLCAASLPTPKHLVRSGGPGPRRPGAPAAPASMAQLLESAVALPVCGHFFHHACIRGWAIVGKIDTCPVCSEKVDLAFFRGNPWDRVGWFHSNVLAVARHILVWQPLIFLAVRWLNTRFFGLH
ncbi:hypothetical protein, variant [Fonticula alba]|uniref:RING-type domain-containing protein n=1 Tax=Fonticula alba TaxID=691883 RepID=A0A058ZCR3_FONAL|nr:hypothetical protein, variant [Fonticula alba]KCV71227.1 hypothetical protein, variant [Fonticula alba]|eukprot:XP_009494349.1 hypothetical protein, variant [Fonticula alba]